MAPLRTRGIVARLVRDFQAERHGITITLLHEYFRARVIRHMRRFWKNYRERHLHPGNQLFHLVGLPVTFILPIHFLVWHKQYDASWALIAFVVGYVLQFIGHAIEGNDAGELILLKRWSGRPYVEFGPRHPSRIRQSPTET